MILGLGLTPIGRTIPSDAPDSLPVGAKVGLLGDSIFARGNVFSTSGARTTAENRMISELAFARFRDPRFYHANWWDGTATGANMVPTYAEASTTDLFYRGANLSNYGDTATGALRRIAQVIASNVDLCIVNIGTNQGAGDDETTTKTKIQQIVEGLVAGGVRVIIGTIRPREAVAVPSGLQISTAQMTRIVNVNTHIRANWVAWGASALWDPWDDLVDPAFAPGHAQYGSPIAGMTADGVHLAPRGSWAASETLTAAIATQIASGTFFNTDPTVLNLLPNGRFTGSGGTVGAGCTGFIATNMTISNATGAGQPVTAVSSLEANAETGGQSIVIDGSSTGAGAFNTHQTLRLGITPTISAGIAATDYVQYAIEFEVATYHACLEFYQSTIGQTSTLSNRGFGQATSLYASQPCPDTTLRGWVFTEPLLYEARTNVNPRFDMHVNLGIVGTFKAKFHRAILRIVPSPQTEFPWVP